MSYKGSEERVKEYNVDDMFLDRWSPRAFADRAVSEDVLMTLFEAAKWAPSSSNIQPWRFIVAQNEQDLERFHSFIMDGNRAWCEAAPVLTLIISKKNKDTGDFNRTHGFDTGTAWGYLALQASKLGLITHGMGGFYPDKARQVLSIPEEYEIHAVIAIGYQDEASRLDEKLQEREKPSNRRSVKESLFEGQFGKEL